MIITINGKYREEGSSRVITFDNYFVNGNQLMGTRTITNSGYNGDGHLVFTISLPDGKIIRADGLEIERIVVDVLPSVNEGDSKGFNKSWSVLPLGFLRIPVADR